MQYNYDTPAFIKSKETAHVLIRQLLINNKYLLHKAGIKQYEQFAQLHKLGIIISINTYKGLMCGRRVNCKLTWLAFFANYWGLSLPEMMSVDYCERDKLMAM
ncbi:hypothetical protein LCGC14_1649900 [marine sediment metagenome]|uniref:Uncharacterized protein n=1 Tax=marine sediment metagenome TaxID=412755 RepID=A0A0F9KXE1_9ZZZZ